MLQFGGHECNTWVMLNFDLGVLERLLSDPAGQLAQLGLGGAWPVKPIPARETIWRWRTGRSFPRSGEELHGLAGALGVDPLVLLALSGQTTFPDLCKDVADHAFSEIRPKQLQRCWFLRELLIGREDWPWRDFANRYFQREWTHHDVAHHAASRRHCYGAIQIQSDGGIKDRVWHFAWRNDRQRQWRPYGFVRGEDARIHLFSYDSIEDEAAIDVAVSRTFLVETWLGPGDADFRVASLHPFSMKWHDGPVADHPLVRFAVS